MKNLKNKKKTTQQSNWRANNAETGSGSRQRSRDKTFLLGFYSISIIMAETGIFNVPGWISTNNGRREDEQDRRRWKSATSMWVNVTFVDFHSPNVLQCWPKSNGFYQIAGFGAQPRAFMRAPARLESKVMTGSARRWLEWKQWHSF